MENVKAKIKVFYEKHKMFVWYCTGCVVTAAFVCLEGCRERAKLKATYDRLFPDGLTIGDLGKMGEKLATNEFISVNKDTKVVYANIYVDTLT